MIYQYIINQLEKIPCLILTVPQIASHILHNSITALIIISSFYWLTISFITKFMSLCQSACDKSFCGQVFVIINKYTFR